MRYKLPSSHKLKTTFQFKHTRNNARKLPGEYFVIYAKPNNLNHPRLGIIIGKRNVKNAVDRNRFKRIVRENFRLNQYVIKELDILVIGHRDVDGISGKTLQHCLEKKWQHL
jgi:ribonuclease P protein component